MQTSSKGIAALQLEEGTVLRAYRCPAGVWTIGDGLTAASGVVKPRAGMVITAAEASRLLALALRNNYEPSVELAMSVRGKAVVRPAQHEFDAGVSFHFNTGAIRKASWVKHWLAGAARAQIRTALMAWNKGGGKVLPGLSARRDREAAMLLDGIYRDVPGQRKPALTYATWGLPLSGAEIKAAMAGFSKLGYKIGDKADAIRLAAAMSFQSHHGLTVDGIIGRATLSTLQRRLDARAKAVAPLVGSAGAVTAVSTDTTAQLADLPMVGPILLVAATLWGLSVAWRYRDVIAVKINTPLPRVAGFLRSF